MIKIVIISNFGSNFGIKKSNEAKIWVMTAASRIV